MVVEYSANNSGGSWWLSDKNWRDLEAAGWRVEWRKERWLGALATEASKAFASESDAVEEWERVTGESASAIGCTCCGRPHAFYTRGAAKN